MHDPKFIIPNSYSSFSPEAVSQLRSIGEDNLFYEEFFLHHPSDVFSAIFEECLESILYLNELVIQLLEKRNLIEDIDFKYKLKSAISNMLYSQANFIDGCGSIIKSIYGDNNSEYKKANRHFKDNFKHYNDHLLKIVNYRKHRHRKITLIFFSNDKYFIPGYFIEGVVSKHISGPDPDIHKDSNAAISLLRDIPYHIYHLYLISSCLSSYILKKFPKLEKEKISADNETNKRLIKLFSISSQLPSHFFPDELENIVPKIIFDTKTQVGEILFNNESKPENSQLCKYQVSTSFTVGKFSRAIQLPYMKSK